jgi:hypothetical protein
MNYKILFMVLYVPIMTIRATECPRVVSGSFEDFIQEVVAAEDHKNFRSFYNDLVYTQQKKKQSDNNKDHEKQQKYTQSLMQLGANSLEVKDPQRSRAVKPYLVEIPGKMYQELHQKVQTFLFRYGAYEEYLQQKAMKHNSMLAKAGSYFKSVGSKVTGWFGRLRRSKPA